MKSNPHEAELAREPTVALQTASVALVFVAGGAPERSDFPLEASNAALSTAFAQFCELCPEHGMVDRRGLLEGVLILAKAHAGTADTSDDAMPSLPSAQAIDLPVAAWVRDMVWQAGRSGRREQLCAALAQAQLRLQVRAH